MKNKLSNLNDHLFAQLERLCDEDLTPEQLDHEHKRGQAIVAVADKIIRNAGLNLQAAKLAFDAGGDPLLHLLQIEHKRSAPPAVADGKPKQ